MSYLLALAIGAICSCWAGLALAKVEPEVSALVPQAQLVGTARMKYLLWNVYDAKLRSKGPEVLETADEDQTSLTPLIDVKTTTANRTKTFWVQS